MAAPQIFFADLVRERCTGAGTGPLALDGPLPGHRGFAVTVPVAALFHYSIAGVHDPAQWEAGIGRLLANGQLERISVAASPNAGALVDFTAGLKTIALTVGASWFAGATMPSSISDVAGLSIALDAKQPAGNYAATGHQHGIADVGGLQPALDSKMGAGQPFASGSAATPSVTFAGATGAGLFSAGGGALGLSGGGAERLRIDSGGGVRTIANVAFDRSGIIAGAGLIVGGAAGAGSSLFVRTPSLSDVFDSGLSISGSYAGFRSDVAISAWGVRSGGGYHGRLVLGASVGAGYAAVLAIDGSDNSIYPMADNVVRLGGAANRFSVVFAASGAISTSDVRDKADVGPIPDLWLDAWGAVGWQRFRFKGGKRWHVGLIAQEVQTAFAGFGVDAFTIGLLCRDAIGEPGKRTRGRKDRWGLRYEECLALEAAWQRREIARLSARLSKRRIRQVAA